MKLIFKKTTTLYEAVFDNIANINLVKPIEIKLLFILFSLFPNTVIPVPVPISVLFAFALQLLLSLLTYRV